jgi:hypothetical protein
MPAYAKDGKVVCFFQSGQKFKSAPILASSAAPTSFSAKATGHMTGAEWLS